MVAARAKLPFIEQMKLFINDIPIYFADNSKAKAGVYDNILDYEKTNLKTSLLIDNVFVKNASSDQLDNLLKIMSSNKLKRLNSITFSLSNYEEAIRIVKKKFSIVKAAGGVVQRDDKTIMIYRLKKWDLPKGKLDKKEKMKQAAVREVEEECNIKVEIGPKICNTWHTYTRNGKRVLKKTGWYQMKCLDDSAMKPQTSENIEDVRWMNEKELNKALTKSYRSVRHVFQMLKKKSQSIS